jgi:hypothetical protein
MNSDETATVKEALDYLAFALAEHRHSWTIKERQLYEKAIRILEEHGG